MYHKTFFVYIKQKILFLSGFPCQLFIFFMTSVKRKLIPGQQPGEPLFSQIHIAIGFINITFIFHRGDFLRVQKADLLTGISLLDRLTCLRHHLPGLKIGRDAPVFFPGCEKRFCVCYSFPRRVTQTQCNFTFMTTLAGPNCGTNSMRSVRDENQSRSFILCHGRLCPFFCVLLSFLSVRQKILVPRFHNGIFPTLIFSKNHRTPVLLNS